MRTPHPSRYAYRCSDPSGPPHAAAADSIFGGRQSAPCERAGTGPGRRSARARNLPAHSPTFSPSRG